MVGKARENEGQPPRNVDRGRIAVAVGFGIVGKFRLVVDAKLIVQALARSLVIVGADDTDGVGMIGDDDDQRVLAFCSEAFGYRYRIVEHNRVIDRTLPIHSRG